MISEGLPRVARRRASRRTALAAVRLRRPPTSLLTPRGPGHRVSRMLVTPVATCRSVRRPKLPLGRLPWVHWLPLVGVKLRLLLLGRKPVPLLRRERLLGRIIVVKLLKVWRSAIDRVRRIHDRTLAHISANWRMMHRSLRTLGPERTLRMLRVWWRIKPVSTIDTWSVHGRRLRVAGLAFHPTRRRWPRL